MKKILFIDRDGTLIKEPPITFQVNSLEEMEFLPKVISSLKRFSESGYSLIMVTNQDGLGTSSNPLKNYQNINAKIFQIFKSENIIFDSIFECPHFPEDNCECRKPKTGILGDFLIHNRDKIDFENSYMIGDRESDREFAQNIGIKSFLLDQNTQWETIASTILDKPRIAQSKRKTKETEISVFLNLDGSGKYTINTGLKFFDHMLEQIGKHGNFDLNIFCKGDLEIDEHHTIEDIAITLGQVFKKALGDKRGITRYAHALEKEESIEKILPMDESLATVTIAIDISSRPELVFSAPKMREYVGDFPTEMLQHFYQSFCLSSGINMNMKIEGKNTHHLVEISFKAFARCLREGVKLSGNTDIVSTKGVL